MAYNALLGSLQRSPPSPVDCYRPPTAGQSHLPPICSTSTGTYLPVESRPAAGTCASGQERRDRSRRQRRARMPARVGVPRRHVAGDGQTAKHELMGPREWLAIAKSRWQRSAPLGDGAPRGPRRSRRPSRRHGRRLPRLWARPRWWRWLVRSAPSWSSRPRPWPSNAPVKVAVGSALSGVREKVC